MRLRVAKITNSYVPLMTCFAGFLGTALAVVVGDTVAKTSAYGWQRWSMDFAIAFLGVTITLMITGLTARFMERFVKAEERARFLSAFSEFLSRSFTFENGIAPLTSLIAPLLGDECMIDIVEGNGRVRRTTSSGRSTEYSLSRFEILNQNPRLFDDGSGLIVPMKARDQVFGTLTLLWTNRNRKYRREDLEFACDVARRAALALDNARLFTEADRANRLNDEFLSTLSHELRTPMNVILGWLDILANDDVDKTTYASILETVTRNANLQLRLIDDLLDVSHIANGKFVLKIENQDIAALASEAVRSITPAARAREIALDFEIGLGPHVAPVDADRIRQAMWNLLTNAVKFTPPGGRVCIRVESAGDMTSIVVEDTGQGIAPDFLPYVFDRFRQEDGTFTRSQGGLGLGLSVASHLVDLHGGFIEARSDGRGRGSAFTIKLRRSESVSESQSPESWISAEI